jgi:site-specific DNA recombinase
VSRRRRKAGDPAKVVGYVRVSTDDQALSPDAQRDALEAWCDDNDRGLVYVAEDRGVSGAAELDKRPGLMEAMAAIREYQAGVLLVFRLDRLSRSVAKGAIVEELVEREGARVLTCDGVGNDASPEGQLMRNMIRSVAQYEREIIAMRTRVALRAKKSRGLRHNCRAPYGYCWSDEGTIEPVQAEQRALRTIRRLRRDEGLTIAQIAEHLNERLSQYPCRGECWHPTTVYRIVRRDRDGDAVKAD